MATRGNKRDRLVAAARDVIYQQGYAPTTLAHVASAAKVPLGNVYYYFKTKEALAAAVIEERAQEVRSLLAEAERRRTPEDRLVAAIQARAAMADAVARHGCPFGSLVQELEKGDGPLARACADLFTLELAWMTTQFRAMGMGRRADRLAEELLAGMQGASLLTHAMRDAKILRSRLRGLTRWVRGLTGTDSAA